MRFAGVVVSFACLLAIAGCAGGGGETDASAKAAYEARMQELPDLLGSEDCEIPDGVEALEERQGAYRERVAVLEDIEPPAEVEAAHRKLVSAYRAYADALDATLEQVRGIGDPREAATRDEQAEIVTHQFALAERETPEVPELAEALREFGERGYTLEPPRLEPDLYEARVNEVLARIDPIEIPASDTMAALQRDAEALGLALIETTEELEGLVPPRPVAEAHEHLVLGICSRGQELVSFGRFGGVEPDAPAEVEGLRSVIATLDPYFEEADGDYRDRGYEVAVPEVVTG